MLSLPLLPWLRAFEVSARHLSFTAAAQELGLSQAAVSKQIKLLELKLGEPLFQRLPRSLHLTKAGEAFLPKVQDAFERLAAGTREVFSENQSDMLTIRCAISFAVNWLAPRLPDFRAKYPEISMRIISSVWNDDEPSDSFDLDIRYGDGNWAGVQSDRLTREFLQPVCSPQLLTGSDLRELKDLKGHTLIHVLGYKDGWEYWLKKAGIKRSIARAGLQVDNSLLAFELAKQGLGIALGRSSMMADDFVSGRLIAPFDQKIPVDEGFYLIAPQQLDAHSNAAKFRTWISQIANR